MEFSIFRLEIRGILFGIAVLCYIPNMEQLFREKNRDD